MWWEVVVEYPGVDLCVLAGSVALDMVVDPLSELMVDDFLLRLRSGAAMV